MFAEWMNKWMDESINQSMKSSLSSPMENNPPNTFNKRVYTLV